MSDVTSLGIVVAGLTPEDFSSLSDVALGGVTSSAVKHLTSEHLNCLSEHELTAIPIESLSLLRKAQLQTADKSLIDHDKVRRVLNDW